MQWVANMITIWVLILHMAALSRSQDGWIKIDNIPTNTDCEAMLKEAKTRWEMVRDGMCIEVKKVK